MFFVTEKRAAASPCAARSSMFRYPREVSVVLETQIETLNDRSEDAYIFPGRRFATPLHRTQAWRLLKNAFARAGIIGTRGELGADTLRKTFARMTYQSLERDLAATARVMGHVCLDSTARLLTFDEAEVDAAILGLPTIRTKSSSG